MSYLGFLTAMHRSPQQIIYSCIAPHESSQGHVTLSQLSSFEPVFPSSFSPLLTCALRISSCKIDGFRSKVIYHHRLSNIMDRSQQNKTERELLVIPFFRSLVFFFTFHGTSTIIDIVHPPPIYTHSLSFQFSVFSLHTYFSPLYQRAPYQLSSSLMSLILFHLSIRTLHPFPGSTISSNLQRTCVFSCLPHSF